MTGLKKPQWKKQLDYKKRGNKKQIMRRCSKWTKAIETKKIFLLKIIETQ